MTQCHQGWKECEAAVVSCKAQAGAESTACPWEAAVRHRCIRPLGWLGARPPSSLEMGVHLVRTRPPHTGHVSPFQQALQQGGVNILLLISLRRDRGSEREGHLPKDTQQACGGG